MAAQTDKGNSTMLPTSYQQFIHKSRYARWLDDKQRRETWEETVDRYVNFVTEGKPVDGETKQEIRQAILNCEVMPSMRALMTAGPAAARCNVGMYNCSYTPIDKLDRLSEILYILMCGTGVGYSVERDYISQLPPVPAALRGPNSDVYGAYKIEDSKTGWAMALKLLIWNIFDHGYITSFDCSLIRPKGARLKTMGGRASGPEPLKKLFDFVVSICRNAAGRHLKPVEVHDICCMIGEVVVVGGVRRSAMISLFDRDDEEMRRCKSGDWWRTHPWRALANNSAVYESTPSLADFMTDWRDIYASFSGEPGIFNRNACRSIVDRVGRPQRKWGTNPCCVSGSTPILTDRGYEPIEDAVGKLTTIWNGESWETVTPYEAGEAALYRVTLSDGSHLDCTANHRWCVGGDFVTTDDLLVGMKLDKFDMPAGVRPTEIQIVVSVEDLGRVEMTYCFTEPKTSRGTFNGIVTGNSEIILAPQQFCNLTEVVVRASDRTFSSLAEKVRIASILGTLQASFTNFDFLSPEWKETTEREALLGVSMTGVTDNHWLNRDSAALDELRKVARHVNEEWSAKLGLNEAAAITCVKPSGTVSQLVDSASGLHPRHSAHYIRRVRGDATDPITQYLMAAGVKWEWAIGKDGQTAVFEFPQAAPKGAITRNDLTAVEHLEMWLRFQDHWCEHKPSVTINIREDEWFAVADFVWRNFNSMSGVAFLPYDGGTYQQAPYEEIDETRYLELLKQTPELDWSELEMFERDDQTTGSQTYACVGGACEIAL